MNPRMIQKAHPPHATAASKQFGRYKTEEGQIARPAEDSGDELDHLRRKMDLLRSMTPEQAMQVIEFHKDLNVFEALHRPRKKAKS